MEEASSQLPADPISAVGVIASLNKAPDGYYAVSIDCEPSQRKQSDQMKKCISFTVKKTPVK